MDKSNNTFGERNFKNKVDAADVLFKTRLDLQGTKYLKLGPDPKENYVEKFWLISPIILLPDYIVYKEEAIYFCEVKGTNKIKKVDFDKLFDMHDRSQKVNKHTAVKTEVGIVYYKNPNTQNKLKWVPFDEVATMWHETPFEVYEGEYELDGTPKMYKSLPM
jgi:hypothetical protein|tara:strand:- start:33 stop:518 length:486 start_codon:yes stop_codon:yes gene_type:complete